MAQLILNASLKASTAIATLTTSKVIPQLEGSEIPWDYPVCWRAKRRRLNGAQEGTQGWEVQQRTLAHYKMDNAAL
jgi:hypothetical protein